MYMVEYDDLRRKLALSSTDCAFRVVEAADNRFAIEIVFYEGLLAMKLDVADGGPAPVYGHLGRREPFRAFFCFLTDNVRDRYHAAALCEQPVTRLFLLPRWNGPIVAAYCRELVIPDFTRQAMRAALLRSYVPAVDVDDDTARRAAFGYHDMGLLPTEDVEARLGRPGGPLTVAEEELQQPVPGPQLVFLG